MTSIVVALGPFTLPPEQAFRVAAASVPDTLVTTRGPDPDLGHLLDTLAADRGLARPLTLVRSGRLLCCRYTPAGRDGGLLPPALGSILSAAFSGQPAHPSNRPRRWPTRPPSRAGARPYRRTVVAAVPPERLARLREWSNRHAPGASRYAVLTAGLVRRLDEAGLGGAGNPTRIAFDLGRRIPLSRRGSATVHLDRRPAPEQVQRAVGTNTRTRCAPRPGTGRSGPAQLTIHHLGRPAACERLPYLTGHEPVCVAAIPPDSPASIAALAVECRGVLHLSLTFNADRVDPGRAGEALRRFADDPIG